MHRQSRRKNLPRLHCEWLEDRCVLTGLLSGLSSLSAPLLSGAAPVLMTVSAPSAPPTATSPTSGSVALTQPLAEALAPTLGTVVQTATAVAQPLLSTAGAVAEPLVHTAVAAAQPVLQTVAAVAQPVVSTVDVVAEPLVQTVANVADPVFRTVQAVTQPLVTTVETVTQPVGEVVQALTQPTLNTVGEGVLPVPTAIVGAGQPVGAGTPPALPSSDTGAATVNPVIEGARAVGIPGVLQTNTVQVAVELPVRGTGVGSSTPTGASTPAVPRLSQNLFLVAGIAPGSVVAEQGSTAADQEAHADTRGTDPLGPFALDLALWGATSDDLVADSVAVDLPSLPAGGARVLVSSDVLGEALLPDGGTNAPAPQADLLATCAPFDSRALDVALQRLLDQLQGLAWEFSSVLAHLRGMPWFLALAVGAVACEVVRRRLHERLAGRAALAGGGGTLTWFPSLTGPGGRDEA
jgi:hypothetical protein